MKSLKLLHIAIINPESFLSEERLEEFVEAANSHGFELSAEKAKPLLGLIAKSKIQTESI